jgi:hypothetical protein
VIQGAPYTRAFAVPLAWRRTFAERIRGAAARGYNAAVVPLVTDGRIRLRRTWLGAYTTERGFVPEVLREAAAAGLSPWLWVDPLSAGTRSGELSPLARREPQWLMRDVRGRTAIGTENPFPRFCFVTPEWRQLLGDVVTMAVEALPVDTLVIDLRALPAPEDRPSLWSYFGHSMLGRMRALGIDPEEIARRPDPETVEALENDRADQLRRMIANLRARATESRRDLVVAAWVRSVPGRRGGPWLPWLGWLGEGLLDEAIIEDSGDGIAALAKPLLRETRRPVPFLASIRTEDDLDRVPAMLDRFPATGWLCEAPADMGGALPAYNPGEPVPPPEAAPLTAARRLARLLALALTPVPESAEYFDAVARYLEGEPFALEPDQLASLRESALDMHARIEDGELAIPEGFVPPLADISRFARMLALEPLPTPAL